MEITLLPEDCINLRQTLLTACLPLRESCVSEPCGFIGYCDQLWNCSDICQTDAKYQVKYMVGDLITLQFNFFNDNDINRKKPSSLPTDWLTFNICSSDGQTQQLTTEIVAQMSGWGCKKSYQVIQIDTTNLPFDCFHIEAIHNAQEQESLCTQWFEAINEECGVEHVLMESVNEGVDCCEVCFGLPDEYFGDLIDFQYSFRVEGFVRYQGAALTYEDFGNEKRTTLQKNSTYKTGTKLPPFMYDAIVCQAAISGKLIIDGEEFLVADQNPENILNKGKMWLFEFALYSECEPSKRC